MEHVFGCFQHYGSLPDSARIFARAEKLWTLPFRLYTEVSFYREKRNLLYFDRFWKIIAFFKR